MTVGKARVENETDVVSFRYTEQAIDALRCGGELQHVETEHTMDELDVLTSGCQHTRPTQPSSHHPLCSDIWRQKQGRRGRVAGRHRLG